MSVPHWCAPPKGVQAYLGRLGLAPPLPCVTSTFSTGHNNVTVSETGHTTVDLNLTSLVDLCQLVFTNRHQ